MERRERRERERESESEREEREERERRERRETSPHGGRGGEQEVSHPHSLSHGMTSRYPRTHTPLSVSLFRCCYCVLIVL